MEQSENREHGIGWRFPVYLAIAGLVVTAILETVSADLGFLCFLLLAPILVLMLLERFLVSAFHRRWKAALIVAGVTAGFLWCDLQVLRSGEDLRCAARWVGHSEELKKEVLTLPQPADDGLRHILWEDFGGMGVHTEVYLVFSPDDGLRHYNPKDWSGLPCEVWSIHRLEKQWYMVKFHSNERWDGCADWKDHMQ